MEFCSKFCMDLQCIIVIEFPFLLPGYNLICPILRSYYESCVILSGRSKIRYYSLANMWVCMCLCYRTITVCRGGGGAGEMYRKKIWVFYYMCNKRRFGIACAFDQNLRCPHESCLEPRLPTEETDRLIYTSPVRKLLRTCCLVKPLKWFRYNKFFLAVSWSHVSPFFCFFFIPDSNCLIGTSAASRCYLHSYLMIKSFTVFSNNVLYFLEFPFFCHFQRKLYFLLFFFSLN